MASITIRNLDSMAKETRLILCQTVQHKNAPHSLAATIRIRITPLGGVDLNPPLREPMREPPSVK